MQWEIRTAHAWKLCRELIDRSRREIGNRALWFSFMRWEGQVRSYRTTNAADGRGINKHAKDIAHSVQSIPLTSDRAFYDKLKSMRQTQSLWPHYTTRHCTTLHYFIKIRTPPLCLCLYTYIYIYAQTCISMSNWCVKTINT